MNRLAMKRIAPGIFAVLFVAGVLLFAPHAYAALASADLATVGTAGNLPSDDIRIIVARLIRVVISLLGIVLLILIVYAGVRYMLARGDAKKVQSAWAIIRNAVIGLAIVLLSYAIATFVLNALLRAAGFMQSTTSGAVPYLEPLSGSLGAGIIQDHYPPRNAVEIPRNTKIIVTFKEPIFLDSLLASGSYDVSSAPIMGRMNADNVKIFRSEDGIGAALVGAQVNVAVTADWKTFVFDPVELLGSPIESQNYTVFLHPNILKLQPDLTTTAPAFPPPFQDGYTWIFQVSTVVDITPPQVQNIIPATGEYARNILVQVDFNEAIDPTAASGVFQPSVSTLSQFQNVQVRNEDADGIPVEGTYVISNGYRTVEFVTFDACGENACGGTIYCLPGGADFTLFVRAAPLSTDPPQAVFGPNGYEGIVDVAGNSLDGGGEEGEEKNFVADGPPLSINTLAPDNFWSTFSTNNLLNTNRPEIDLLSPAMSQADVPVDQDIEITFSEPMRISTLTNQNIGIAPRPTHELWYVLSAQNQMSTAVPPAVLFTRAIVEHGLFRDYEAGDPVQNYYPLINNEVATAYQICFYPAYGPPDDCDVDAANPSCCLGEESSLAVCPIPNAPPLTP